MGAIRALDTGAYRQCKDCLADSSRRDQTIGIQTYVVMLCYVMLCYVMLCYVMLCYVMYLILAALLTYDTVQASAAV